METKAHMRQRILQLEAQNRELSQKLAEWESKEAQLTQGQNRLHAILEDQTEMICRYLPDFILTYVNDAYCRSHFSTLAELIGKSFIEFIPEGEREDFLRVFSRISRETPVITTEHKVYLPSGEARWQQWHDRAIFDARGNIVEYQAVGRDITDLKRVEAELASLNKELEHRVEERARQLQEEIINRQKTEQALQKSEASYYHLIENLKEGFSVFDENGVRTYVNDRFCEMVGYSRDELIGHPASLVLDEEGMKIVKGEWERRKKGNNVAYEVALVRKDGSKINVIVSPESIFDADGAFKGGFAVFTDITERKAMETSLRESEATLRALLKASPESFFLIDANGIILAANEIIAARLNLTDTDITGKDIFSLLPPEVAQTRKKRVEGVIQTGKPIRFEDQRTGVYYENYIHPICDENGAVTKLAILGIDITERKQAEIALQQSEERYRTLVEQIPAITYSTILGQPSITSIVSPQIAHLGIVSQDWETDERWLNYIHPEDRERVRCNFERAITGSTSFQEEYRFVTPDGRTIWVVDGASILRDPSSDSVLIQGVIMDITAQKAAEEELRRQKALIEAMIKNLPLDFWARDRDDRIIIQSDIDLQIWGYQIGKTVLDSSVDDVHKKKFENNNHRALSGETVHDEFTHVHQGQNYYFSSIIVPVWEHDTVQGTLGININLTERIEMEKALRKSEERYRRLAENARDMIFRMTIPDAHYDYVSPASQEIIGYTPEELYNTPRLIWHTIHPASQKYLETHWDKLQRGEVLPEYEYQVFHKSGEARWLNQRNMLVRDENGNPIAIEGIVTDVTKRKQAEQALRRSEERYRSLVEVMPDALVLTDINGRILVANARMAELFGYEKTEELNGQNGFMLLAPDNHENGLAGIQSILQSGNRSVAEFHLLRKDNSSFIGETSAVIIQSQDGETQFLVSVRDVTERKQAQALQQELEVLRQVDQLRTELIGNVSHEMRTPIGLTLVMITALQSENIVRDADLRQELLADIEEETRKLQSIVDGLLDISRIQNERMELNRTSVDVQHIIHKLVNKFGTQVPQRRFVHLPPHEPLVASIDVRRIEQVLNNLLDNAIKYSPFQTEITIQAVREQEHMRIAVGNSGAGVPPPERERIFERFYRLHEKTPSSIPGLGLGLSICRGIVEAHAGKIWVEDRPGGGCLFIFTLPQQFSEDISEEENNE